ncbi:MAG TPA: competence/damage-inducible protein A [Clostridia bacterium]|nr:competence/damage-inducible protein A [Clostridia bacterium]
MYNCEIICVGTELLLGDILNTDAQFLSKELASMGIAVLHQSVVGDNKKRLKKELETALSRSDIVITSGGLGPTPDDITREVCCDVMGFETELNKPILNNIKSYFEGKNKKMPESNKKQAYVPIGGVVFENTNGTAPGAAMERDGKCMIILPGPPNELKPMFINQVKPLLQKYSSGAIVSHTVRTMGIGESAMAELVGDLLDNENPTVAPYAKNGEALLRITAKSDSEENANSLCVPMLSLIRQRLGNYVYGIDVDSIEQRVVELLIEKEQTIALAESCTAGYISKRITDVPGSSKVFECGIVSYSDKVKIKLLGISPETFMHHGVVSEQTAKEMAKNVRIVGNSNIGIGITGVAGPGSDENSNPAGIIYIALAGEDSVYVEKLETNKPHNREYNRFVASSVALNIVRLYLEGCLL